MSSDTNRKNHRGLSNGTILSDTQKKTQTHRVFVVRFCHFCIDFSMRKAMTLLNILPGRVSAFEDQGMHLSSLLLLPTTDVFVCRHGGHRWDMSQSRIKRNQNELKGRRVKSTGVITNLPHSSGQTHPFTQSSSQLRHFHILHIMQNGIVSVNSMW